MSHTPPPPPLGRSSVPRQRQFHRKQASRSIVTLPGRKATGRDRQLGAGVISLATGCPRLELPEALGALR